MIGKYLTAQNHLGLLSATRSLTKRQTLELLVQRFPKANVLSNDLTTHSNASGDLAVVVERALDARWLAVRELGAAQVARAITKRRAS